MELIISTQIREELSHTQNQNCKCKNLKEKDRERTQKFMLVKPLTSCGLHPVLKTTFEITHCSKLHINYSYKINAFVVIFVHVWLA